MPACLEVDGGHVHVWVTLGNDEIPRRAWWMVVQSWVR